MINCTETRCKKIYQVCTKILLRRSKFWLLLVVLHCSSLKFLNTWLDYGLVSMSTDWCWIELGSHSLFSDDFVNYFEKNNYINIENTTTALLTAWSWDMWLDLPYNENKKLIISALINLVKLTSFYTPTDWFNLLFIHIQPITPLSMFYSSNSAFKYGVEGVSYCNYLRTGSWQTLKILLGYDFDAQSFSCSYEIIAFLTVTLTVQNTISWINKS